MSHTSFMEVVVKFDAKPQNEMMKCKMIFDRNTFGFGEIYSPITNQHSSTWGMVVGAKDSQYAFLTQQGLYYIEEHQFIPATSNNINQFEEEMDNSSYVIFMYSVFLKLSNRLKNVVKVCI